MLHFESWTFGDNPRPTPGEVWEQTMGWLLPWIKQGGIPLLIGGDQEADEAFWNQMVDESSDEALGRIAKLMRSVKTMVEYKAKFEREILPLSMKLTAEAKQTFAQLHELRKKELGIG